jgi:aspartyl-tRNA(Asn)/glutamyl-tRNA(Gln) amidotransferase subunit A
LSDLQARNQRIRAFTAFLPPEAASSALSGALFGYTLAVKANIALAGLATTAGLKSGPPAREDAALVAMLRAAGATVIGHTNMDEAALGATTDNPHWGRTENPRRPGYTPGGSSGGSAAAVASGMARLALGTDTLGSVRIPAAYTGLWGLKASHGLLPLHGIVPLAPRLDAPGLIAATLADLEAAWAVLVPERDAQAAAPLTRLALLAEVEAAPMAPAVRAAHARAVLAARALGLCVTQHPFRGLSLAAARLAGFHLALENARPRLPADQLSPRLARLLAKAPPPDLALIAEARSLVLAALQTADALLLPTTPSPAFPHGEHHPDQADFTALANFAGLPALSVPAGSDKEGLPVGVQLIGRPGSEASLMALARRLF